MKDGDFDFKKLTVWQHAVEFADNVIGLCERLESSRNHFRLIEQIEAAVTSISMNIAEGKGRNSPKEFIQFLAYARGSLYETVTLLEIFKKRNWISTEEYETLELKSIEIAKMLNALITAIRKRIK